MTRRRKLTILTLAGLAIIIAGAWVAAAPVETVDGLTGKDVIFITRTVRKDLWRGAFPGWSLGTLKALPGASWAASRTHIHVVRCNPDGTVQADAQSRPDQVALYRLGKQGERLGLAGSEHRPEPCH